MLYEYLREAVRLGASDLHISPETTPKVRIDGTLRTLEERVLSGSDVTELLKEVLGEADAKTLERDGHVDLALSLPNVGRFRTNLFRQRGTLAGVFRLIPGRVPALDTLGLPPVLSDLARLTRGLVLVVGATGSGKSTTLAAMIDQINRERACHIVTLEDPIEYLHPHGRAIVNQREVGTDAASFAMGLKAALRQDPDVILVGEMRDLDTIATAITAAETGHLVLATLHAGESVQAVDRIIDVFPAHQQSQIRVQLSDVLQAVVAQQLLARRNGGRVVAAEVLLGTPAVRNLVREGKTHQIASHMETGSRQGMQTMAQALEKLRAEGVL